MITDIFTTITPYIGIGPIKLGMTVEEVRDIIKTQKLQFDQWIDSNKGCDQKFHGLIYVLKSQFY